VRTPTDDLLDEAARLLAELRALQAVPERPAYAEDLLAGGYATALALEGARRRLRRLAVDLSERELALAAREQELRDVLGELRRGRSRHEPTAQSLH